MPIKSIKKTRRGLCPINFIYNLNLEWVSTSSIKILSGACRDSSDKRDLEISAPITIDITNDLDTGDESADKWYYVYLLFDKPNLVYGALFSINSTIPTLGDFTHYRLIGCVRNDSSSNFLKFAQFGNSNYRKYIYYENRFTTLLLISGGSSTNWTNVDCSSLIPVTTELPIVWCEASVKICKLRTDGEAMASMEKLNDKNTRQIIMPTKNQIFEYKNNNPGGSTDLAVLGFEEHI